MHFKKWTSFSGPMALLCNQFLFDYSVLLVEQSHLERYKLKSYRNLDLQIILLTDSHISAYPDAER